MKSDLKRFKAIEIFDQILGKSTKFHCKLLNFNAKSQREMSNHVVSEVSVSL